MTGRCGSKLRNATQPSVFLSSVLANRAEDVEYPGIRGHAGTDGISGRPRREWRFAMAGSSRKRTKKVAEVGFPRHGESQLTSELDYHDMLRVALEEAHAGLEEGGIPIGAALFDATGTLLGRGHNRRVQDGDPSVHAETDAFRKAGRRKTYRDCVLVSTLAPCWYCSGLVRQFKIGTVVAGESVNFEGGLGWLRDNGVHVVDLRSDECVRLLRDYIASHAEVWNEDIGQAGSDMRR